MSSLNDRRITQISVKSLALTICTCLGLSGCNYTQTVWSSEVKSPDGKYVVTARTSANSGFGIDGIPATFVYLNWATGSQKPMEIMEFANEGEPTDKGEVGIKWLSPKHVEIRYSKRGRDVEFQAVKYDDVCISLRDESGDPTSTLPVNCPK